MDVIIVLGIGAILVATGVISPKPNGQIVCSSYVHPANVVWLILHPLKLAPSNLHSSNTTPVKLEPSKFAPVKSVPLGILP